MQYRKKNIITKLSENDNYFILFYNNICITTKILIVLNNDNLKQLER